MKSAGVNRFSLGVQSFDDEVLRRCGRSHNADSARAAIALLKGAQVQNFNVDLIFGMPGEAPTAFENSINEAVAADVPHVTIYPYRSDTRTTFSRQIIRGYRTATHRQDVAKAYDFAKTFLEDAGYQERVIGYFAKRPCPDFVADEYYFGFQGDYFGFGSGAKSVILGQAIENNKTPLHQYIKDPLSFDQSYQFSQEEVRHVIPRLVQALWLPGGINYESFRSFFGFSFDEIVDNPMFDAAYRFYRDCGAIFIETKESLSVSPETRASANLAYIDIAYSSRIVEEQVRRNQSAESS